MTSWLERLTCPGTTARLGPLERRVLESLWARRRPATARDLFPDFIEIAPTTLTTTLDRLARKGVLDRLKDGRAYVYRPRLTRQEFEIARASSAVHAALHATSTETECHPLLTFFVDAIGERDPQLLAELDALIQARRARRNDEPG